MSRIAIRIGFLLVIVSVVFAILTGTKSFTNWIPALLGILLALLGWLEGRGGPFALGGMRLVALAGLTACIVQLVHHGPMDLANNHAHQSQAVTAVLCALLLVRSFITPMAPPPDAPDWRRHT